MLAQTPGYGPQIVERVFFTGCDLHATATSRTQYTTAAGVPGTIKAGDIVQRDPFNHEGKTDTFCVGIMTPTFNEPLYVVTRVDLDPDMKTSKTYTAAPTSRRAGYIEVRPLSESVGVKVTGATTAGVTKISPVATATPNHTTHAVPWTPGTVTQYETIVGGATAKPVGTAHVTQGAVTAVIACSFNGGAL
jgi:hypothetical protein